MVAMVVRRRALESSMHSFASKWGLLAMGTVILSGLCGCLGIVEGGDDEDPVNALGNPDGTAPSSTGGIPCSYLRGRATLTRYTGDNYASSAFSFEYASQDPDVTNNEFDVLYDLNHFRVNTVTDDVSFIVDLGDVAWAEVPEMVDPEEFPLGNWGEHDAIEAYLGHTYFVRNVDSAGRGVAAFRVLGLEPGVRVTIDWVRSVHPDRFVVPTGCELPQDDAGM